MSDDRPVFVDLTGRRRRTVRTTAILGACLLFGVGALIVFALLGASSGPPASLPDVPQPVAPGLAEQPPAPGPIGTTTTPRSTGRPGTAPATTTTTTDPAPPGGPVETTTTRGKPGHTPPGKPTDLPTPPGHTR